MWTRCATDSAALNNNSNKQTKNIRMAKEMEKYYILQLS